MVDLLSNILTEIDSLFEPLTILFPGFVSYFIYIGLRTEDFEGIKRSHVVLILFFTLFFQIISDLSGDLMGNTVYTGIYFFVFPIFVGITSDISYRLFISKGVSLYQGRVIERIDSLKLIDVGNVTRWQKTIRSYVKEGIGDITKEYYVEIELTDTNQPEKVKRGFLNGYSENDVEIIRYDDLSSKHFGSVGAPEINEDELTLTVEIIPRENIATLRIYRIKMEDFHLGTVGTNADS